jgi:hypothetical protein
MTRLGLSLCFRFLHFMLWALVQLLMPVVLTLLDYHRLHCNCLTNVRLGCKCLTLQNTLANYTTVQVTTIKSFKVRFLITYWSLKFFLSTKLMSLSANYCFLPFCKETIRIWGKSKFSCYEDKTFKVLSVVVFNHGYWVDQACLI